MDIRKPFIVAEMSANHNGSLETALDIVEAAAKCGADAVKLQTWKTMVYDEAYTIEKGLWKGWKLADLYKKAETPWVWHKVLFDYAKSLNLTCFSTPFDYESLDFLESLNCPIYKVASFELTDIRLIKAIARTGKPMILSTGMASMQEINEAIAASSEDVTVLKCTSAYPASPEEINLPMMTHLGKQFGLSDHTQGIGIAVAATALGASVIEKHITLSGDSLDGEFSLLPHEFRQMVTECRKVAASLQRPTKKSESNELRRSLYIAEDMQAGDVLTEYNLRTARPALGLPPSMIDKFIGSQVIKDVRRGTPLTIELISPSGLF